VNGKAVPRHEGLAVSLTLASGTYVVIDCDAAGHKQAGGVATAATLWAGKTQ